MKLLAFTLVSLSCIFIAFGLQFRSGPIPQTLAKACPSAQHISSSTHNVNGHVILQQVFSCPDGNFTMSGMYAANKSVLNVRSTKQARSAVECTTPAAECQCGQALSCDCFEENGRPVTSDCTTLIDSLAVLSSIEGPTFIVQPDTVRTTSLRTCAISFINLSGTPEEYCWDELANAATGGTNCLQITPWTDSLCMSFSERFAIHLGETV